MQWSATRCARASPALAASNTSFAVTFSLSRKRDASLLSARNISACRAIPVAEAICSRQPLFPQLQASGPFQFQSITICPISPPMPLLPATIRPSRITPPPTPVPSVTATTSLYPFPPPCQTSPSAATLASFPPWTGMPPRRALSSFTGFMSRIPILTQTSRYPSGRMGPGTPIPAPARRTLPSRILSRCSRTEAAMSGMTCRPPFSFLVGISHFSTSSAPLPNSPSFAVVPPRSTPAYLRSIKADLLIAPFI